MTYPNLYQEINGHFKFVYVRGAKFCQQCKVPYLLFSTKSKFDRKRQIFCSNECRHKANTTKFIKGQKPINYWLGKKQPLEMIEKRTIKFRGELHYNWKGGISRERHGGSEYRQWRKQVFERDNYTCIFCGKRSEKGIPVYLEADHIKPWAKFPEYRYELSNGRALCKKCHSTTDTYKGRTR